MSNLINSFWAAEASTLLNGLIVYYKMDEASGGTMNDAMGNVDGTYESVPDYSETGAVDTAINFDTVNDAYADIPTAGGEFDFGVDDGDKTTDKPFSISLWVDPIGLTGAGHWWLNSRSSGADDWLFANIGTFEWGLWLYSNASNYIQRSTTSQPAAGVSYHAAVTYDGSGLVGGIKIYWDGIEETVYNTNSSGTYTGLANDSTKIRVAAYGGAAPPSSGFPGIMDEIKIWGRELTSDEVFEDFTNVVTDGVPLF